MPGQPPNPSWGATVLQRKLETAIWAPGEALLGQGRPRHVATEPLKLCPIVATYHLLGVQVR